MRSPHCERNCGLFQNPELHYRKRQSTLSLCARPRPVKAAAAALTLAGMKRVKRRFKPKVNISRPSTAAIKMSLKLLVDKRNQTVLFAEAGKDFVDFLFRCLALPVGSIMSLLAKTGVAGGFGNLYASVENLSQTYIKPREKDALLNPKALSSGSDVLHLLLPKAPPLATINFNTCPHLSFTSFGLDSSCRNCVMDFPSTRCPCCNNAMSNKLSWVAGPAAGAASLAEVPGGEGGYVRGVVTYMVMDDLVVKPMSIISSITLLKRFNVQDIGDLEEKVIDFGLDEAIKLLNASLHSKTVLTDIFSERKHQ